MKNHFPEILLPTLLVILWACSPRESGTTRISGALQGGAGKKLKLDELRVQDIRPMDSLMLGNDGTFSFAFSPEGTGFYLISNESGERALLIAGKGDELVVSGSYDVLPMDMTLQGPEEATDLLRFFQSSARNRARADSLQGWLYDHQADPDFAALNRQADSVFDAVFRQQQAMEEAYVRAGPGRLSSLVVLTYTFGPRPVLTPKDYLPLYLLADSALQRTFPDNPHAVQFHKLMEAVKSNP
jgi:hypothetical protein